MIVGSSKLSSLLLAVALIIFAKFIYETKIITSEYHVCSPGSPNGFSSTSKQMTLNSHFALNTVFRVESFSKDALVLRHVCFKIDADAYSLLLCISIYFKAIML